MIIELTEKYQEKLEDNEIFSCLKVDSVNHEPHPYTIGPAHINHAQKYGGKLGQETVDAVPCAVSGCNLSYDEHTSDTVIFLQLKRDAANDEVNEILKPLFEELENDGIQGLVMVETEEKFRINE